MPWTEARRQRQAALIHEVQPWRGGGVRTPEGKRITRYNAVKHGMRSEEVMQFRKLLTRCDRTLSQIQQLLAPPTANSDFAQIPPSSVGR